MQFRYFLGILKSIGKWSCGWVNFSAWAHSWCIGGEHQARGCGKIFCVHQPEFVKLWCKRISFTDSGSSHQGINRRIHECCEQLEHAQVWSFGAS